MPTLADIYSAINTAKRKGADFVQNPGTSLQQMLGNANDQARGFNQLNEQALAEMQQTNRLTGPAGQKLMSSVASAYDPMGMTVWHGSPHPFAKFDMSKIGTGEGNQAYGRGMYVAQAKNTGEQYQKELGANIEINGKPFYDQRGRKLSSTGDSEIDDLLLSHLGNIDKAIADAQSFGEMNSVAKLMKLKESGTVKTGNTGYLYKVDLPDTHIRRMVDFDEPLKNQPKKVRDLAKSLGIDLNDAGADLLAQIGKGKEGADILQKAGIPGIKYLDQASRNAAGWHITPPSNTVSGKWMVKGSDYNSKGAHFDTEQEAKDFMKQKLGEATRNFVVFDPNHLSILERNNRPIK
jgi:hypothetical protein